MEKFAVLQTDPNNPSEVRLYPQTSLSLENNTTQPVTKTISLEIPAHCQVVLVFKDYVSSQLSVVDAYVDLSPIG